MKVDDTYRENGDKVVRSDRIKLKYKWNGMNAKHRRVTTQVNLDNVNGFEVFKTSRNLRRELEFMGK